MIALPPGERAGGGAAGVAGRAESHPVVGTGLQECPVDVAVQKSALGSTQVPGKLRAGDVLQRERDLHLECDRRAEGGDLIDPAALGHAEVQDLRRAALEAGGFTMSWLNTYRQLHRRYEHKVLNTP
ncbi:hypothetical protein [Streptomyces sp. SID5606]|uniref:hypothetical protein n=1 Tax=Streptomyces sp. SID5606 TaxID=2690305 RepID=UPI001926CD61|nr:hypothetical protein [Streptomyces sp. SID5606]